MSVMKYATEQTLNLVSYYNAGRLIIFLKILVVDTLNVSIFLIVSVSICKDIS